MGPDAKLFDDMPAIGISVQTAKLFAGLSSHVRVAPDLLSLSYAPVLVDGHSVAKYGVYGLEHETAAQIAAI
jgi:hypothetical protein